MILRKPALALVALAIAFSALTGSWESGFAVSEPDSATFWLTTEQPAEVYLGKGGVSMVKNYYNGSAVIHRIEPDKTYPSKDLQFVERWIEFHVFTPWGEPAPDFLGLNYVYFDLTKRERLAWEDGLLNIYYYDRYQYEWLPCPTKYVADENPPHGRLACVMTDFGLFGLAKLK